MRGPCPCPWKMQHIENVLTAIHMSVPCQCPCQCTCEIAQGAISHAHGHHTDGDSLAFLTYISGAHVQHPFVLVSTLQSLYEWAISQLNNCYYSGAYPHYPLIRKALSRKSFHTRGRALEGAPDSQTKSFHTRGRALEGAPDSQTKSFHTRGRALEGALDSQTKSIQNLVVCL